MKRILSSTVFIAVVLLVLTSGVAIEVPKLMQYQGHLTDEQGAPVDTIISMTFTIYNSPVGGTIWWTETQDSVVVSNGLFNVLLGSVNAIYDTVFADTLRWLGITIGDDPEISPRTMLVTVPYAYRVSTVDGSFGGRIEGDVNISHDLTVWYKATIGPYHTNTGDYAFVAGYSNTASGDQSTVSGGENNSADSAYATVAGGATNTASGERSSIGGGVANVASNWASTISGGFSNTASGYFSTIGGGYQNTNAGAFSVIPGGRSVTLTETTYVSMGFGEQVYVSAPYRVIFFDGGNSGCLGINRDDLDGGIYYPIHVGTNTENGNGAHLTPGGVWQSGSSRSFKENFQPLDRHELLAKISNLPIEAWQFKDSDERHIGPVSEDFVQAFDVGLIKGDGNRDNKYLAAGDVAGVALAGVKELIQENKELKQIIKELRQRLVRLEKGRPARGGK